MKKILFGASIYGIQSFIFQTNKLKDIIGASEIVKTVCDTIFKEEFLCNGKLIINAAGNIKCIYENEQECMNAVLKFSKRVMEYAPGISISQAVVTFDEDNSDFNDACEILEEKLHAQRNRPTKSINAGLIAINRSRTTGLPSTTIDSKDNNAFIDECTLSKRNAIGLNHDIELKLCSEMFGAHVKAKDIGLDLKDITGKNDWVAIIHIDGNGLGEVVSKIGQDPSRLHEFSEKLDVATKNAAKQTCKEIFGSIESKQVYPIRPVLMGGDDLTVICRADIAFEFVQKYLRHFESESAHTNHKLSACAGIAYIKSSYPFHYGYKLAETLCGIAKTDAKSERILESTHGEIPSCVMFHKVQSCFVENFNEIQRKELTPQQENYTYKYGPYYLKKTYDRPTIDDLKDIVSTLSKEENNNIKTAIREWLTLMAEDANIALQKNKRTTSQLNDSQKKIYDKSTKPTKRDDGKFHIPAYDILSLLTVENQVTK